MTEPEAGATGETFRGDELRGRSLRGRDLRGARFLECDLTDTSLADCDLRAAEFVRCHSRQGLADFSGADCSGAEFKGCRLDRALFHGATLRDCRLRSCRFSGANFQSCEFDGSVLEELDVSRADFHLASLLAVRVLNVRHEPALETGPLDILRLLWQDRAGLRTIFTAGTELSPFIAYCAKEYRLSQMADQVVQRGRLGRVPGVLLLALFGLISDWGASLGRWLLTSLVILTVFAGLMVLLADVPVGRALYASTLTFVGSGAVRAPGLAWALLAEQVMGYFMLGVLVSVLATRFIERW